MSDPAALPYWRTKVVPGGDIGGILATAAADEDLRRIYISTAPGEDSDDRRVQPTASRVSRAEHGYWRNHVEQRRRHDGVRQFRADQCDTGSGVRRPGALGAFLRAFDTKDDDGTQILNYNLNNAALASAPIVIDGVVAGRKRHRHTHPDR